MKAEDFVFEIGVEEIPARFIPLFEREMETYFLRTLEQEMLSYDSYTIIATPRRIGIYISSLAYTQGTKEEHVLGPSVMVAWKNGIPTPALEGFLKKYNISVDAVLKETTPKGEYVAIKHTVGGQNTEHILSKICYNAILHLATVQKMHWGDSTVVFARPIVSLLALYGSTPISIEYGPCSTQNPQYTFGHRILCNKPVIIPSAEEYWKILREQAFVLPLSTERKEKIQQGIREIEEQYQANIIFSESLLEENTNLCEYPFVLLGDIDTKYLSLPKEVFLTTIERHQRSFGLVNKQGALLPHFITVTNNPHNNNNIKVGWERVLRARLEDAMFFYSLDKDNSFENWLEQLEHVIFITSLGTMRERALRIQSLAVYMAQILAPESEEDASRAGLLCKADLVSAVVKEMDTLQGIMGGIYAKEKGKGDAVARAIAEHYLPAGPSSPLPSTMLGSIVALADKIDMVVGCFAMKMIPTGTTDTQGLRRAVLGIVRIILEYNITTDFKDIFLYAKTLYGAREWKLREEEMLHALSTFFATRIKQYCISLGFSTTCIDAVLHIQDSLPSLIQRIEALHNFIQSPKAKEVSTIFKRVSNIVEKERTTHSATEDECDITLFEHEAEHTLYTTIKRVLPTLRLYIQQENYMKAMENVEELYISLQQFFDSVLVLVDNRTIRNNRIIMLNSILCVLERIADFKELQL